MWLLIQLLCSNYKYPGIECVNFVNNFILVKKEIDLFILINIF